VPRTPLLVLAVLLASMVGAAAQARPARADGWEHLGSPLSDAVNAWSLGPPGVLYAGGDFTDAAGDPSADYVMRWDGTEWSGLGATPLDGPVYALAYKDGLLYAGGNFINQSGGDPNARRLAAWDGTRWGPVCNGLDPGGPVQAMQIIGSTLYIGGAFQDAGGIAAADSLVACDLTTGTAHATVAADGQTNSSVNALAADSNGTLYAGGGFSDMAGIPAADFVAAYDGSNWHALGSGNSPGGGAESGAVLALAAAGTDIFVGGTGDDIAGIPQADHLARWDGSAWHAVGSNAAGTNGWFPSGNYLAALAVASDGRVYAGGFFQNADANPRADFIAAFDGRQWRTLGSNGAGDGALNADPRSLALFDGRLYAGGSFMDAGGDASADWVAAFSGPLDAPFTSSSPLPAPTEGKTVNVVPASGTVLVKVPSGSRFVPLATLGSQIPVGSTIDTTRGVVRLSSATNAAGTTQTGLFSKGQFRVLQTRKNPLTTVAMTGAGLNFCSKRPRGGSPKAVAAARKHRRSLFANVHGHFRTRGRNSVSTVRGTQYIVKDTCAGTLTKVKRGIVEVHDLTLGRTRIVKAGHSYFARAPK
jgi:hypothetical protein